MTKALIIGSSGQDGILLGRLLKAKGYHVTGVSRTARAYSCDDFIALDIAETARLGDLVRRLEPDEIYYLAAYHHSSQRDAATDVPDEAHRTFAINLDGYLAVLDAVSLTRTAPRIFYACSALVFGNADVAVASETTDYRPRCLYSIAKLAGLHVSEYYRAHHRLHVSVGILFNHESTYRGRQFLPKRIVDGIREVRDGTRSRLILGDLNALCDWGYAGDYVNAMWRMLQLEQSGTYIVATGQLHSVRDWVDRCCEWAGLQPDEVVSADPSLLTRSRQALAGDSSRLTAATGWAPTVTFDELVRKMYTDEI